MTRTTRTRMIKLPNKLSQNFIQTSPINDQEASKKESRKVTI